MVVEAEVWYWTRDGMRQYANTSPAEASGYIRVREVERLLEATHRRAYELGQINALKTANALIRDMPTR